MEDVLAVHLLDQMTGGFALAKAGDIEIFSIFLKRLGDRVAESGGIDGDFQLHAAVLELFIFPEFHFLSSIKDITFYYSIPAMNFPLIY